MIIDATFWVAISFFIFTGGLLYLKVPQKIDNLLTDQINKMKNELDEAEKIKIEAKNLLGNYEKKIDKSKKEVQKIISSANEESEKIILEKTEKFHQMIESKKKNTDQKIYQIKQNAIKDIKNISVKIGIETVQHLIKNSIDKNKVDKIYTKSLEEAKASLKHSKS